MTTTTADSSSVSSLLGWLAPAVSATPAAPAVPPRPIRSDRRPASVGCSLHAGYKTVFVASDLDGSQIKLFLEKTAPLAKMAHQNNNELHYVFMGGFFPFDRPDPVDARGEVMALKVSGVSEPPVRAEHIHVLLGPREVGILRLMDRSGLGELTWSEPPPGATADWRSVTLAEDALKRPPPITGVAEWADYERGLREAFETWDVCLRARENPEKHVPWARRLLAVAMFFKMEALVAMTLGAGWRSEACPGLLRNVLVRHVNNATLQYYLKSDEMHCPVSGNWLQKQCARCFKRDTSGKLQLTEEATPIADFAESCLDILFKVLNRKVGPLLQTGSLVKMIEPPSGQQPLWLMHGGTNSGRCVGYLPKRGVASESGVAEVQWERMKEGANWANELNNRWSKFVSDLQKAPSGEQTSSQLSAWVAMSLSDGPLRSNHPLPLQGLEAVGPAPVVGAVAAPAAPFGSVQRTLHITSPSLTKTPIHVWMRTSTAGFGASTCWAAFSWCARTKAALLPDTEKLGPVDLQNLQYDINLTLAALIKNGWGKNYMSLRGGVGPLLRGGHNGKELLRAVWWAAPDGSAHPVLTLLPEAYLRHVLNDYFQEAAPFGLEGVAQGLLDLPEAVEKELTDPGISEADQAHRRKELGPRVWSLQRFAPASGSNLHLVSTHVTDPLSGLVLRWVFLPGQPTSPTLDVDNGHGGLQRAFEVVVE